MNPYDAILGLELSDEEKMRVLADSLRNRQQGADFFAATTVPSIRQAAQAEQERVGQTAEGVGVLRRALAERQSREREGALNRQNQYDIAKMYSSRPSGAGAGSGAVKYGKEYRNNETGEIHLIGTQGTDLYNFTTGEYMDTLAGYTPNPMSENQMQRATANIPDDIQNYTKLIKAFERADSELAPFALGGADPRTPGEIPGAGRWSGKPGAWGWVARRLEELWEKEGEVPDSVYSAMENVVHLLVQEAAGLTQTRTELEAQYGISGKQMLANPMVIFKHYDWIKDRVQTALAQRYRAQSPAVQQQWNMQFSGANEINPFMWEGGEDLMFKSDNGDPVRDILPGFGGGNAAQRVRPSPATEAKQKLESLQERAQRLREELGLTGEE